MANRDRLLEYDATSARRTRVLDDEMDYFVSEGAGGAQVWLSPEARERVQKRVKELRAQRHASRLEAMRFCLDFAGRELVLEDDRDEAARQLYNPNQSEMDQLETATRSATHHSSTSAERNPKDVDSLTDPTLGISALKFVNTDRVTPESNGLEQNALVCALRQPLGELRLQDDGSRQLTDEGYCLSMHQPWASFLIRGIKKDEGRVWYSAHRGPLWIASTVKVPDPDDIDVMEKAHIASGGSKTDLPTSYPTGCLLGRVNVFPDGPSTSPFVFICDDPREVLVKFPVSGKHKIYKLDPYLRKAASKNLA
ncbi:unnamed protein product [Echinostoma caproni]|uniref:Activating signal cointegrator 1 third domain-containing protein n=1 Tax=Echinostoma caproni TaxID=27848 RepID=A0A3P8IVP4_9TREM|nr:unnamed protein product [Echinostoma caproni]